MDPTKFDKRTIERNLKSGTISQKEYDKYLAKLPDLAEDSENIDVPLYPWEVEEAERKAAEEAEQKALEEAEQEAGEDAEPGDVPDGAAEEPNSPDAT